MTHGATVTPDVRLLDNGMVCGSSHTRQVIIDTRTDRLVTRHTKDLRFQNSGY